MRMLRELCPNERQIPLLWGDSFPMWGRIWATLFMLLGLLRCFLGWCISILVLWLPKVAINCTLECLFRDIWLHETWILRCRVKTLVLCQYFPSGSLWFLPKQLLTEFFFTESELLHMVWYLPRPNDFSFILVVWVCMPLFRATPWVLLPLNIPPEGHLHQIVLLATCYTIHIPNISPVSFHPLQPLGFSHSSLLL